MHYTIICINLKVFDVVLAFFSMLKQHITKSFLTPDTHTPQSTNYMQLVNRLKKEVSVLIFYFETWQLYFWGSITFLRQERLHITLISLYFRKFGQNGKDINQI